jgi:hypothetical protein
MIGELELLKGTGETLLYANLSREDGQAIHNFLGLKGTFS